MDGTNGEATSNGNNSAAMNDEIRAVCEELNSIDDREGAIRAKHKTDLAPIKKDRKTAKGRVKALGIDQQDIDYWRGIFALEDQDKRRATLQNIATILPSLDIGETVDWVTVLLGDEADVRPNFLKDKDASRETEPAAA